MTGRPVIVSVARLRDLHAKKLTLAEIGAEVGCSAETVRQILIRRNIPRHRQGPTRKRADLRQRLDWLYGDAFQRMTSPAAAADLTAWTRMGGWRGLPRPDRIRPALK